MKNLIKFFLFFTLLLKLQEGISRTNDAPGYGVIISQEINNVNGTIMINIKYTFSDTTIISSPPIFNLPQGWTATNFNNLLGNTYLPGSTLNWAFAISYPTNNLPFYPQEIKITQISNINFDNTRIASGYSLNDDLEILVIGRIYFTPYNTAEIWDVRDFYNLPRRWLNPENNPNAIRISVPKSSIPVSNIDLNDTLVFDSTNWNDNWRENFRKVRIPGLAYSVLMKPVPQDSIAWYKNYADGPDSLSRKRKNSKNNRGCDFSGVVEGSLSANIINDIGAAGLNIIPLSGIMVTLYDEDGTYDDEIEYTYTDSQGHFRFEYCSSQSWFEGDYLELYLEFKSKTSDVFKIRSKNAWGWHYIEETFRWDAEQENHYKNVNLRLASLEGSDHSAFRAVHWANNGYNFFKSQGITLKGRLLIDIYIVGTSSDYVPYGTIPEINLAYSAGVREGTIYHEFGHHAMYRLNWNFSVYAKKCNQTHSWGAENTSMLALSEGWASAVGFILDANYWREDNEYARDYKHSFLLGYREPLYEVRYNFGNDVNNGLHSEYYFACALYDLWDGPNRGLPNTIQNPISTDPSITYTTYHGWNDSLQEAEGWQSLRNNNIIDDIEIPFNLLCLPDVSEYFLESTDDFQHYFHYLIKSMRARNYNDDAIAGVSKAMRENRLQLNVGEYNEGRSISNIATDYINVDTYIYEEGCNAIYWSWSWNNNYFINYHNIGEAQTRELVYPAYNYQTPLPITDALWLGVWDQNVEANRRESNLFLNDGRNVDQNTLTQGSYRIAKDVIVEQRNGLLQLGQELNTNQQNTYTANLDISDKAILRIKDNGNLELNNSNINIQSGGTFSTQTGADVESNGNSQIIPHTGSTMLWGAGDDINLNHTSQVFVHSGVNFNIEPGVVTNLNNSSKIIISNGAILNTTGSNFYLKDNSNLTIEPNGKLNATGLLLDLKDNSYLLLNGSLANIIHTNRNISLSNSSHITGLFDMRINNNGLLTLKDFCYINSNGGTSNISIIDNAELKIGVANYISGNLNLKLNNQKVTNLSGNAQFNFSSGSLEIGNSSELNLSGNSYLTGKTTITNHGILNLSTNNNSLNINGGGYFGAETISNLLFNGANVIKGQVDINVGSSGSLQIANNIRQMLIKSGGKIEIFGGSLINWNSGVLNVENGSFVIYPNAQLNLSGTPLNLSNSNFSIGEGVALNLSEPANIVGSSIINNAGTLNLSNSGSIINLQGGRYNSSSTGAMILTTNNITNGAVDINMGSGGVFHIANSVREMVINSNGYITLNDGGNLNWVNGNINVVSGGIVRINQGGNLYLENCTLTVKTGSRLLIKNQSTLTLKNSYVLVETGGFLCVETDAIINIQNNSSIYTEPGINPDVICPAETCNCMLLCDLDTKLDGKLDYEIVLPTLSLDNKGGCIFEELDNTDPVIIETYGFLIGPNENSPNFEYYWTPTTWLSAPYNFQTYALPLNPHEVTYTLTIKDKCNTIPNGEFQQTVNTRNLFIQVDPVCYDGSETYIKMQVKNPTQGFIYKWYLTYYFYVCGTTSGKAPKPDNSVDSKPITEFLGEATEICVKQPLDDIVNGFSVGGVTYYVHAFDPQTDCEGSAVVELTIDPVCGPGDTNPNCGIVIDDNGTRFDNYEWYDNIKLTISESWNNHYVFVDKKLTVSNGTTLTIQNSQIIFGECGKLVVENGGTLNMLNSTCTSCQGTRWQGIRVYGDYYAEQTLVTGQVAMLNSKIGNADIGILVGDINPITNEIENAKAGGKIKINKSEFIDNRNDIVMLEYKKINQSRIQETDFVRNTYHGSAGCEPNPFAPIHIILRGNPGVEIIDNTFKGDSAQAIPAIKAEEVSDIKITGNTFTENISDGVVLKNSKNFTIRDNNFSVKDTAIQTEYSLIGTGSSIKENKFNKVRTAITFNYDDHRKIDISCNQFNYREYAIHSENTKLKNQGTLQQGAGNTFTSLETTPRINHQLYHNGTSPLMTYYYDPAQPLTLQTNADLKAYPVKAQKNNVCLTNNIRTDKSSKDSSEATIETTLERNSYLIDNIPNPFEWTTTINYRLNSNEKKYEIRIYNIIGKQVGTFPISSSSEKLTIDCKDYEQGIYFYGLFSNGTKADMRKMVLIK